MRLSGQQGNRWHDLPQPMRISFQESLILTAITALLPVCLLSRSLPGAVALRLTSKSFGRGLRKGKPGGRLLHAPDFGEEADPLDPVPGRVLLGRADAAAHGDGDQHLPVVAAVDIGNCGGR